MDQLNLNQEQKKAVCYQGGPLLIIAGAGTGKTTVITERIKWLINEKGIPPSQIVALTFTEKAAGEMEERVDLALPLGYSQLWISTFHSFCDRVLREEAIHIGLDPNFKILTEAESILFLSRHLFRLKLDYFRPASNPTKFLHEILNHFSRLRDEDITPEKYLEFAQKIKEKADTVEEKLEAKKTLELALAFKQYQELKEKEGVMDFADLITNTLRLFRERPNILKNYREKFRHLLVDEFQDTNIAQYELIKLLVPPGKRNTLLTVTGDDSQSIYKFRGAAVSNILTFKEDYPEAKIIVLTKNYRSTQLILDHAYRLIKHNDPDTLEAKLGISKNLKSMRKVKSYPVKLFFVERGEEEAELTAKEIEKLTRKRYQFKDVAILFRANNQAEPFVRALARRGIPYQFLGPGQLFRQPEIKDLIAYLKLLHDPNDDVALFRLSHLSVFSLSPRDLAFILSFARRWNLSLFEAFEQISQKEKKPSLPLPSISEKTKKGIEKIVTLVHRHLGLIEKETGGQILYYFLHDSGLLKQYSDPKTEKDQLAALNIARFFDKIKSFESQNEEASVSHLLDWITLRLEMGESPLASEIDWSEKNAVNLLTVHSAKGLEFPVVFIPNLVDRRFPTIRKKEALPLPQPLIKEILPQGDPHLQEERRLFYVAMTRAKDRLYFTAAKIYPQGKLEKRLSPFVKEALGEQFQQYLSQSSPKKTQLSLLEWEKESPPPLPPRLNPPVTYLSFSQIDSFSICPRQYKYKYLLKIPTPPSPSQTLGDVIHRTLKLFYQRQLTENKPLSEKDLLNLLDQNWSSEGFPSKAYEKTNYRKARKMLSHFYQKEFDFQKIGRVIALEQPFSFKLTPTLTVGGIIDRVDNLEGEKIEIIDYKTGSRTPSQKDVDRHPQLTLYALAVSLIKDLPFHRPVEKIVLSLYFLDEGKKISSQRTAADLEKTKEKIIKLAQEIETTEFPPKPHRPFPCDYCEFKLLCDAWR